jgi:hypothetical protein
LIAIMPTNNRLLAMNPSDAGPESRKLIQKWAQLHAARIALGALSTGAFLAASFGA